jgi:hypothetical protein
MKTFQIATALAGSATAMKIINCLALAGSAAASMNGFCQEPDGTINCSYPCRSSVVGGFDCQTVNKTWTCNGEGGYYCPFDTTCAAHGLFCNASYACSMKECDNEEIYAPFDGGCGCGCASTACGGIPFASSPIDPKQPFDKNFPLLSNCIKKPETLYRCDYAVGKCVADELGLVTEAQCNDACPADADPAKAKNAAVNRLYQRFHSGAQCTGHAGGEGHQADGSCVSAAAWTGALVPEGYKSARFVCGAAVAPSTVLRMSYANVTDCGAGDVDPTVEEVVALGCHDLVGNSTLGMSVTLTCKPE